MAPSGPNTATHDSDPDLDPIMDLTLSTADLRSLSIPTKRTRDAQTSSSAKRKGTPDSIHIYSRPALYPPGYWSAPRGGKVRRLETQHHARIELHQSTCLNLNGGDSLESDLWILPDFEEWEAEAEEEQSGSRTNKAGGAGEWAPLVERAVNSNRERLRLRLEGDGWDFVGGKYGEVGNGLQHTDTGLESCGSEEASVDEEFDVVVLPPLPCLPTIKVS